MIDSLFMFISAPATDSPVAGLLPNLSGGAPPPPPPAVSTPLIGGAPITFHGPIDNDRPTRGGVPPLLMLPVRDPPLAALLWPSRTPLPPPPREEDREPCDWVFTSTRAATLLSVLLSLPEASRGGSPDSWW